MAETRKKVGMIIIIVLLLIIVAGLVRFVHHRMRYAVTNAVFVETDRLVNLGFEDVSGRLIEVFKNEGEEVKAGEPLALLDSASYQAEVKRLSAELAALKQRKAAQEILLARIKKDVSLNEGLASAEIERLKAKEQGLVAELAALQADIEQLSRDKARFERLYQQRLVPKRRLEEVETALKKVQERQKALLAEKEALKIGISQAQKRLLLAQNQRKQAKQIRKEIAALEERIKGLEAALSRTKLLLSHCTLKSPIDGVVAKRFHVAGDVVGPGEPVFALVDPHDLYLLVLLEETKLHGVEPGCQAKVRIDAYSHEEFEGVVEEVLPATAAKFALVPRDVSAGEFTKVAQRVPIKIRLTKGPVELLRVGLGGEVEILRHE